MSPQPYLRSEAILEKRINDYFEYIEGEFHLEPKPGKDGKEQPAAMQKVWDRDPQPATYAGLALFVGFTSLKDFDKYLADGKYADKLAWGLLRIQALYEIKLHGQSATGAIFALKRLGWDQRDEPKTADDAESKVMRVEILDSGAIPAPAEKDVVL
ncbi:MAG: terminase small subunit [Mucilaginibacter sp.]|uniref:terminase small subunit n=1 Tax=Mucilaginibacter sp. L3T2-6 TaxID=3062491 RepID=UPI0026755D5A|nr:terminase small subunit [Mucilaginibacter sp. L3T2-6]MDO3644714.1 terminase small subunit [Mucilaginibacter sp. L3T2-6]MDV6217166.1 terminase small subunit [Mucilaginibacter sp. L3T2-6]